MSTDALLARLGPKSPRMPSGARKVNSDLESAPKQQPKLRRAMELRSSGVESITRVHGSQTQSMDYDAQTPIDIAGAVGMVSDPLCREILCIAKWPSYQEQPDTRVLILRRVMDEMQRRLDLQVTAALKALLQPKDRQVARELLAIDKQTWPTNAIPMYRKLIDFAMLYLDGSGLPESPVIAEVLHIGLRTYHDKWRDVLHWIRDDLTAMVRKGEGQFKGAVK